MKEYTECELLRLAKRYGNKKRGYLLVNPLMAKHIPVAPNEALLLMRTLGEKVAALFDNVRGVVAFAETATAIGAMVARAFGGNCLYLTTTRETYCFDNCCADESRHWLTFAEEHSHAVTQRLFALPLTDKGAAAVNGSVENNSPLIFVDDEISTGRTLLNVVKAVRTHCADCRERPIVAASLINRQSDDERREFAENGIECVSLLTLPKTDYEVRVADFSVTAPTKLSPSNFDGDNFLANSGGQGRELYVPQYADPRLGVDCGAYFREWNVFLRDRLTLIDGELPEQGRILVLGTEECMLPALLLGNEVAKRHEAAQVFCHATTRSPIGVGGSQAGYPIGNGYALPSFYDATRQTYVYNLAAYDAAIAVSDAPTVNAAGCVELARALAECGTDRLIVLGMHNVWHIQGR